jgi:TRAP-type mannitol/chloroaromatic compound transport system substrate-binding protein
LGLYRSAPFYYGPGFNKPNGTGECIVSLKAWNALDAEMRAIIAHACAAEASFALAEMERLNADALRAMTSQHGVKLRSFPVELVASARARARDVIAELAARGERARRIHDSYLAFRDRTAEWSRISIKAVLDGRDA